MKLRLLIKSTIAGIIFLFIYLLIVILTTPNFPPLVSVSIALNLNGIYIYGGAISLAVQTWIIGYSKTIPFQLGLPRTRAKSSRLLNVLGSIGSAFFSFFALIGVGCCGTWLFILSLLPGILGVGVTSFLIQYSTLLAQIGLGLMIISNIYAFMKLRKKLKIYELEKQKRKLLPSTD